MGSIEGRTWLEVISPAECWRLLGERHLGRLAFVGEEGPEVLPVNYAVDGETIVFRTDPGTKLTAAVLGARVGFEIDDADARYHTGWSVLVKGWAQLISDAGELRRVRELPLRPWAFGEKAHWVRILADQVTGRRIARPGSP